MASLLNNYSNIPGMPVEFKDGGTVLRSDTSSSTTKSMLILGTAEDGPVLEPVAVDNTTVSLFGKSTNSNGIPNGSTLVKDFEHAWNVGCRDIRLMRVTGSPAQAKVSTAEVSYKETFKTEESKGIVGGNDLSEFTLSNTPVDGSAKVYVNGSLLSRGYSLSEKTLTVNKNACNAGALVTVTYSTLPDLEKSEILTVDSLKKVTLSETPKGDVVVKFNGEALIKTTDYTISAKEITISKSDIAEHDEVQVEYTYTSKEAVSITENSNLGKSFITKYTSKIMTLTKTPISDSIRIYVNNVEVSNTLSYTISETNKITLDKKYFNKLDEVVVSYLYEEDARVSSEVTIETKYGGEVYNQARVVVTTIDNEEDGHFEKIITLHKPESKKLSSSESALVFKSSEYPTFNALVNAINSHSLNNVFTAYTDTPEALTVDIQVVDTFLTGGDNGLNCSKQEIFKALSGTRDSEGYIEKQGAFQILENYMVDFIVPGGVYSDDVVAGRNKDFAYELALLCAILTARNKTTLGAIPTSPCNNTSLLGIQNYVKKLLTYSNVYPLRDENGNLVLDDDNNPIDLGRYIHVVPGPDPLVMNSELGVIAGNPAVQFIAELTCLKAQSSPLNKVLHGVKGLKYNFQTAQLDKLIGNRMITFNTKQSKNNVTTYRIVDGVTCAFAGSEYARTTTLRCLQEVVDEFREAAEPFFGEPPTTENRNALAAAISKKKETLLSNGVAEDISFQLVITTQDYLLGEATLEVDVVPPREFRKINMVVGLKNTI